MREEKLIELPRFKGTDAADWIYPYKKEFVLQTHTENITFDVRCSKKFKNESTGFLLPYITESKLMGRFLKDTGDVSFNGYIECASGRCNVNPDYSKEENVGTRILNASQGARVRVYFYIALKEAFFYDFDVDGRKPKEIARIACNLSVFSASPPQSINESFKLEFKPTCDDRIKDQGEDEVDCGGPCPQCKCRKDENCGRSEWVGKMYCWDAFSVMARRFKFVSCEKPLYDQPFCNSTIVQKSLNYPCIEKGYY
jgi:hypothetical protein